MKRIKTIAATGLLVAMLLPACSQEPETGPGEVRWDRDTCARCRMAVSDHHYSAQVRGGPTGERTNLHMFDDLGCAVIWLEQQTWRDDPRTEVWVTDHQDGSWVDARTASYVTGKTTPMDYGLGAQAAGGAGTIDFTQAVGHIHAKDTRAEWHETGQHQPEGGDGEKP